MRQRFQHIHSHHALIHRWTYWQSLHPVLASCWELQGVLDTPGVQEGRICA